MDHIAQIAGKLADHQLDAMLLASQAGERYAVGFHGEGAVLVTAEECLYCTDSRYIEAAEAQVAGVRVVQTGPGRSHRTLVREAVEELGVRRLGFEEGAMSVASWRAWKEALPAELAPAQKLPDTLRAADALARAARAEVVQVIGTKFVLYRESHNKEKKDKIVLVKDKRRPE